MLFDEGLVASKAAGMRCSIVRMLTSAGSGHPGGSLSATDIVATLFFGGVLRYDASDPGKPDRDRFILSKGHAAPVLYAALAHAGFFAVEELDTLRRFGSRLQGHPDMRKLPGVEVSTGSLGQGLSIACGLALGLGIVPAGDGVAATGSAATSTSQVFVLLGDGELQEGQVWEAAMFAAHHRQGNLVAIVDNNDLQIDGRLEEVVSLGSIVDKFRAFGWEVVQCDGHNIAQLHDALQQARSHSGGPVAVVAHTVKGKGVSFMEGQCGWHGKAPNQEQCDCALGELGGSHGA